MVVQPFKIVRSVRSDKFYATFVSDSCKKGIPDRKRYNAYVELDPWDRLIDFGCNCEGFIYSKGKKICKHILGDENNPGILHLLKIWGEINEIQLDKQCGKI